MLYGSFSAGGTGKLVAITGKMDGIKYKQFVEDYTIVTY